MVYPRKSAQSLDPGLAGGLEGTRSPRAEVSPLRQQLSPRPLVAGQGRSAMVASRAVPLVVLVLTALLSLTGCGGGTDGPSWVVTRDGDVLEIAYGTGADLPQYAALHLSSGYLRLVPTRVSGWGTSVIVMPSFWSGGAYHQGGALTATTAAQGSDLVIVFLGAAAGLQTQGQVRLSPPGGGQIRAVVSAATSGLVTLDSGHPGEAFKPVMLSSMHTSATSWDASAAFVGSDSYPLPAAGWIVEPPVTAEAFGLEGGSSAWKTNAPTIEVTLDTSQPVTGWVADSDDPNGDNIGLWAASDTILPSWSYSVVARD